MKKILVSLSASIVLLAPLSVFASANMTTAQSYLLNHSDNPWSTMGLAVSGASSIPSDYLKNFSGSTAIEYAAPILALTALNKDPRTFGNADYVAKLKSFDVSNQIGDPSTTNDDVFGLLALISSGVPATDQTVLDAKNFILANQQPNGGWGFATAGGTDSNITSAAIVALIADGTSPSDTTIQNGFNYLLTAQNADGGFTYDPQSPFGTASDSSSTAWVIWALNSAGINPATWTKNGQTPTSYLESNQTAGGYFEYQTGSGEDSFSATTTAYAVIALAGKTLPINIYKPAVASGGGGGFVLPPPPGPIPPPAPTPTPTPAITPTATPSQVLGAITYAEGTLVKTADNATVYIVKNGKFRPFSSEKIFYAYVLKFSDVQIIGSDVIMADNLSAIMDYPDGTPHE